MLIAPGRGRLGLSWLTVFRAAEPAAREAGRAKEFVRKNHRYANDDQAGEEDQPCKDEEHEDTEVSVHGAVIWEWFWVTWIMAGTIFGCESGDGEDAIDYAVNNQEADHVFFHCCGWSWCWLWVGACLDGTVLGEGPSGLEKREMIGEEQKKQLGRADLFKK